MNSRYLYKAKRLDNGKWVEGYYYRMSETRYAIEEDYERNPVPTHHYILFERMTDWGLPNQVMQVEIDPSTLCQCTGIVDKNGKLIWENEKCLITRPCTCTGVHIVYKDACFFGYDKFFGSLIKLFDLKANGYEIEVVSDNPELLEVGE